MRGIGAARLVDNEFDMPPLFAIPERRMAGQAVDRWRASGGRLVDGFAANSLVIGDPAGAARIISAGTAISGTFGLASGMLLDGRDALAAEIRAACDLISVDPQPVPFEASLSSPAAALLLVRAVALPIDVRPGRLPDRVQVVANWREVLDRAATTRLRRELGAELRLIMQEMAKKDPFLRKSGE